MSGRLSGVSTRSGHLVGFVVACSLIVQGDVTRAKPLFPPISKGCLQVGLRGKPRV